MKLLDLIKEDLFDSDGSEEKYYKIAKTIYKFLKKGSETFKTRLGGAEIEYIVDYELPDNYEIILHRFLFIEDEDYDIIKVPFKYLKISVDRTENKNFVTRYNRGDDFIVDEVFFKFLDWINNKFMKYHINLSFQYKGS